MQESSEVLARKYRPKNFEELIGQESISQTLSLALDANRLSHAYLFSGLRGSGKTSTARIFAKALICEKGISHKPCGECHNCINALENRHIDIVEMDGASSRKIDDIRDLIEQTKYKPTVARFKIFIIDEVHMLTKEAFNALLKTLEEPPSYVKFILATTDPLKLPATILSRTQHFRFKSIATNKITDHLAYILNLERIKYEQEALEILARSGSGSLRDTLTLLDQAIIYSKNYVDVRTVTDMLGLVDPKFLNELFGAVFARDYAKIVEFVKALEDYESQMVVDELIAYLKERMYASDTLYSTLVLDRFFRILSDAKYLFSINADGSFVLSLIFFKMVEALRIKEVDQMIESLQKEIYRPQITTLPPQEEVRTQSSTPIHQTPKVPETKADPSQKLFAALVAKVKDRNIELGECFEKSISFLSYEDGILRWESCTDEECKKILTHGYSVIKQFVREIFGFETKIKHEVCSKVAHEVAEVPQKPQETEFYEPSSMIEESEMGGSASCVTNCQSSDFAREIDGAKILEEPMLQRATELFEATKITVQSKV
ncbi:MAG: DNA polymerase III subunit gamma/tau [Sulfurimonas sp.]|uniref:DNA polymerase III subunit gamma/tau n=1 Tax=Sulfurimonas sp. TaxID=2022749 RepID=UPI00262AA27F|nr:DNA polymerase III subunit gamma/tau [Sulfurimonas sp.]MDD2652656.1 DNA polymerase III subunit gamma/tau [Sulfurimonas sp.]MDD3450823.1 DNA polymerase III subunit gamma/tau [Sulfurimonas sp.]